jgi:hypothetical protein
VAVLFVPSIVPIIDVFRALADFQEHYDIGALDELEGRLCASMSRDLAKGLVSDALLLAFGLGRERTEPARLQAALLATRELGRIPFDGNDRSDLRE